MLQQVMTAPGEIIFKEVPVPEMGENDVLLRMVRIGVCGSDVHVFHGKHPFTRYPITQGHEVSAIIEKIGAQVSGLRVGQKATVEPQVVCGECHPCRHGKYNLCEKLKVMGFQTTGMASEYFVADAGRVTPLPDTFSLDDGAMIEPVAVAVHAATRAGDLKGKDVTVLGAGPIGNLVMQVCKGLGARRALITDISDFRLELARECGADKAVNTAREDFVVATDDFFGADRADVIFDCAGNDITIGQAITGARKGSQIILVAVFADMAYVDLATLNDHELILNTSMMYRHEHYIKAIELVERGAVRLSPLQSKHFAFADYLAAYRYIDANRDSAMKVLIDIL